jgi:hypothetical protein
MKSVSLSLAPRTAEAGNILVYVLGAIFLLGILIMLLRGAGMPGSNIEEENMMIRVAEVQEYGIELETAIAIILRGGYVANEIRFAHPDADPAYGNITDEPGRQVFAVEGGGAIYRTMPPNVQATPSPIVFNAANRVPNVGSNSNDLIAFIPGVSRGFCVQMNDATGIANAGNFPPGDSDGFDLSTQFTGSFDGSDMLGDVATTGGRLEGCLEDSGTYVYFRVLLPR